jgi:hypothetical protein
MARKAVEVKYFKNAGAQGELRFLKVSKTSAKAKRFLTQGTKVDPVNGKLIVGHSETGHHHVMDRKAATMYRLPNEILECLLVVHQPDKLEHLRNYDTHTALGFKPGHYIVRTGREMSFGEAQASQD